MDKRTVSAVIPTRGDVDLGAIVANLLRHQEIAELIIIVGDTVFNRYVGAQMARFSVIFTQDDDCIPDIQTILDAYQPGAIVNAMTEGGAERYSGNETLVGYGALFDKRLTFVLNGWQHDGLFLLECDRVFTSLNPHHTITPSIEILPWARSPNRMYKQPDHNDRVRTIRNRVLQWKKSNSKR